MIKNFIEKHDPKPGITLFSHDQLIKVLQANTKDCPVEFYAKWRIIIEEDIIKFGQPDKKQIGKDVMTFRTKNCSLY